MFHNLKVFIEKQTLLSKNLKTFEYLKFVPLNYIIYGFMNLIAPS